MSTNGIAALAAVLAMHRNDASLAWRAEMAADHAVELATLARGIKRRGVRRHSHPLTDRQIVRDDAADSHAYARAAEIAAFYGATMAEMEDVRGYAIRLHFPARGSSPPVANGWSSGWGVPSL